MQDITRVLVSDLHAADKTAIYPPSGMHPYGWLSPDHAIRFAEFIGSKVVSDASQLIVTGDATDLQICPINVKPPTAVDVLSAPHNKPIVDALRTYADGKDAHGKGHTVLWLLGNHDLGTTADDVHYVHPKINFLPFYNEGPLRIQHGHDACLFNGPDPMHRDYPLGYFISRFVATAVARGLHPIGLSLQLLFSSKAELVALLNGAPLAECVFDAVCKAARIAMTEDVIMPDGSTRKVEEVRATYSNLLHEWTRGSALDAAAAEYDPYYGIDVGGTPHLHVMGHSHDRKCAWLAAGGYMNLGAWCGEKTHFGRTWLENPGTPDERLCGQVCEWRSGVGIVDHSTILRIPTT